VTDDSKGKDKGLDTCYSAIYTSQTRDQQRFTILEVQLIGMSQWCHSALCGHPLPALMDSCTHGAASRDANPPVSAGRLPFLRLKYGIPLVCATSRFFAAPVSKTFASFFFTYLTLM